MWEAIIIKTLCTRFNRAPSLIRAASIHPITITSTITKKTWSQRKYWNLPSIWGGRYSIKSTVANFKKTRFLPRAPKYNGSTLYLRMQLTNTSSQSYRTPPASKNWNCPPCTKHSKSLHCIVTSVCTRVLPLFYFTSYIVNDVSCILPNIFVVVKAKPLGTVGSVSWEMQNGGKHNKYLMFLCTCE